MAAELTSAIVPQRRRCAVCGEIVGVYEPVMFVFAEVVIESSIAARPELLRRPGGSIVHRDCFSLLEPAAGTELPHPPRQ